MLLFLLFTLTISTTVSYRMAPHDRACFYTEAKKPGEKIGFYFAVQEGGNFDVDFEVMDPAHKILFSGIAERQGDFVFTSKQVGEYQFCFANGMSTFAEKLLDFDISVEHELKTGFEKSELEASVGKLNDKSGDKLEKSVSTLKNLIETELSDKIQNLMREQRTIRTNEHRNYSIVKNTEHRILWFAVIECIVMVGLAVGQVYVIQSLFSKPGRIRV